MLIKIVFSLVGGLGIFLLGMKNMSEGMQAVAGSRLRKLISVVTSNRFLACGVGVLVTSIVQSSSVTSVMVIGFVNSGLMNLSQAIGVILGANIGTTITGWILVLKIGKYGLPLLGVAAFVYLFSKKDRARYIAMAVMGIGMIFFGLELMSSGLKPLREMPAFLEWFQKFQADSYLGVLKCAAVGCVLTMIVQSSSATLGITMSMASTGLIGFPTAAALVLGENIGTTITAYLASLGATTNAKRAAYSHTIFNVIGVLWITLLFRPYIGLVGMVVGQDPGLMVMAEGVETFPKIRLGIALTHSCFNIVNTLIFLPFIQVLARIVTRLAPDKPHKEAPHLTFLDIRMLDTPAIGIQQSMVEVLRMGECVGKMMNYLGQLLSSPEPDEAKQKKVFHREEVLDVMQREIVEFLGRLVAGNVTHQVMDSSRKHLRMSDEYESIGDYVAAILKLELKMSNAELVLSEKCREQLLELHKTVNEYVGMVNEAVSVENVEILSKARVQGDAITHMVKEARDLHMERMKTSDVSPLSSLVFNDMLTSYRRIKDHTLNIAEALAGEK